MANAQDNRPLPLAPSLRIGAGRPNAIEHHLGRELRAMYDRMPVEPADDRIAELMRRLVADDEDEDPPQD